VLELGLRSGLGLRLFQG